METVSIPIRDLKVSKDRIREDFGEIEALAASIKQHGQLQPIIINRNNELIAGGRRVAARMHNKDTHVDAVYYDAVDELTKREIELEENLRRKELTWVEEVRALRAIFELKQQIYGVASPGRPSPVGGGYSLSQASNELDRSQATISQDITLAKGLDEYPELANEKSKSAAFRRLLRAREVAIRTEQAKRRSDVVAKSDAPDIIASLDIDAPVPTDTRIRKAVWATGDRLYLGDCRDVLKQIPDASIDCIVTDPPFAIGMFKEGAETSGQRLAEGYGTMYDDDPHRVMDMLDAAFMHMARILKPRGHAYVFFHMTRYEPIYLMMVKHFGVCDPVPIMWIKNTPGIGDPNNAWVYAYEPIFWINRGNKLVKPQAFNYLRYETIPAGKKIHPMEKPAQLLRHLISASCVAGETILDPFAGSGSTLSAAIEVGCHFIGIEQNETFHRIACERLSADLAEVADNADSPS